MVKAIRVHELGGPEVLKWEDMEIGEPKEGEIRAIGVNFSDVYFRTGNYKTAALPFTAVRRSSEATLFWFRLRQVEFGSLLCQCANALGATVIGTVSAEEKATQAAKDGCHHVKATQAAKDGCHHVIMYTKENFAAKSERLPLGTESMLYTILSEKIQLMNLSWSLA